MPHFHCLENIIYAKYMFAAHIYIRTAPSQTRKQRAYIFARSLFRVAAKNKRLHAEIISTWHNYLEEQFRECIKPAFIISKKEVQTIESFETFIS